MFLFIVFIHVTIVWHAAGEVTDASFSIRHYSGKMLTFFNSSTLLAQSHFRDRFRWRGLALLHMPSSKCLVPVLEGRTMKLGLTNNCNSSEVLFQYDSHHHSLMHFQSGKCAQFDGGINDTFITLGSECYASKSQFWQVPEAAMIIRHVDHLCWVVDSSNVVRLQKMHACDRFVFDNAWNLQHYETSKCLNFLDGSLRLSEDCNESKFVRIDNDRIRNVATGKCIQTANAKVAPAVNSYLEYASCASGEQFQFPIYEDRGMIFLM